LVLLFSCALVGFAALLASRALGFRRISVTLIASWCIGNALVLTPIHVLGFAGWLERTPILVGTTGSALIVLALSIATLPAGVLKQELRAIASLPLEGLRALRASPARIAVALTGAVLLHAMVGALQLPSDSWDGIWYHETIVGGALQLEGYGVIPLPQNLLQQANGFPRNAEMVALWLVLLRDRSVIELPNACALVPFVASSYLVAARFSRSRSAAIALSCAACLLPGAILQLRSTYVDVYAAAAGVAAIALATQAPLRARDIFISGLALALFAGAKSSALLIVPVVLGLLVFRAISGDLRARLSAAAATLVTLLSLAAVYLKNAIQFKNPFYPIDVALPRLGVHFPGVTQGSALDVNASSGELLRAVFLPTPSGRDYADIRRGGFGLAVAWLLVPLATLGLVIAARRAFAKPSPDTRKNLERLRARWLLLTVTLVAPAVGLSPALWSARYHLVAIGLAVAPAAYALADCVPLRARNAVLGALLLLDLVAIARFDPPLGAPSDWSIEPSVAEARERELGAGTVVAFGPGVAFPSVLYNDRFDNRLAFVVEDTPRAIQKRLTAIDPVWVVAEPSEPLYRFVADRTDSWEVVGLASRNTPTVAFRRKRLR